MVRRRRKRKYTRHYDRFADGYALDLSPEVKKSIIIIVLVLIGGVSLLSLFGLAGFLGDYINEGMAILFGWGRWLFPVILILFGFLLYNEDKKWVHGYTYVGLFFFILSFQSLLHVFYQENPELIAKLGKGGGYIGLFLVKIFVSLIGFWAALLVLVCLFMISLMLMFNSTLSGLVGEESLFSRVLAPMKWLFRRSPRNEYEEEDEGEEGEDEEIEEDEEAEYAESRGGEEFSSHEVASTPAEALTDKDEEYKLEEERPVIKRSNLKIELPLDLLSSKVDKPSSTDIEITRDIIKRTLENFDISVEMGEAKVGPTVTQYTFKPAGGIKLNRITSLSNDLALATAMHPVRIEAPIPGKSLVGVEIPNKKVACVGLRAILDTKEFRERRCNTMIALGKDVAGLAWLANLAKMPHLLVAGTTGSGKSVCLKSIIVSLLYQNNPDDLKFILVDPKRVELPIYNGIPYLLTPVITDIPKTINALKWCLNEMDRRFDILATAGKRDIESYNAVAPERMPHIIFIVDELAYLMVAAARDVEAAIIRLAQMARAVGIHLILATQRPSVDILTGLIKANIPARIAFSVSSAVDSRTILDTQGADKLLGRGDMLFITAELSKPKRIQGAFVSDKEIKRIVRYIKEQTEEVEYDDEIIAKKKVSGVGGIGLSYDDSDDLYEEAKELVINSDKASTSFLQRRLRIGYARAARIIDLLEENGVIGPANGAKSREILISKEEYAKVSEIGPSAVPIHNKEEVEFDAERVLENEDDEEEDVEDEDEEEVRNTKSEVRSTKDENVETRQGASEDKEKDNEDVDEDEEEEKGKVKKEIKKEEIEEEENMSYSDVLEEEDKKTAIVIDDDDEETNNKKETNKDLPPVVEDAEEELEDKEEEDKDEGGDESDKSRDEGDDEEMERMYSR